MGDPWVTLVTPWGRSLAFRWRISVRGGDPVEAAALAG